MPNRKGEIEREGTKSNRECVVVSPHRSRAAVSQGHQQFQSVHWYWVWSQQNVLIPERQGGKGAKRVGGKEVKRYTSKIDTKNSSFPISKLYNYNGNARLFQIVQSNKQDSLRNSTLKPASD